MFLDIQDNIYNGGRSKAVNNMSTVKIKDLSIFVTVMLCTSVSGFCRFPCPIQERTFTNEFADLFAPNPFAVQVLNGSEVLSEENCIERDGQFSLTIFKGEYVCNKHIEICNNAFVVYGTIPRKFNRRPSLCEVCKGTYRVAGPGHIWRAKDASRLGCEVPSHCPSTPNSCTGSEKDIPDAGLNCNIQRKNNVQRNHRSRKSQRRHYGYRNAKPIRFNTKKYRYANGNDRHHG
ncbi:uncharacterized protein LOC134713910 isoform X2 [Mytilus trossulus]|uniref:uncharacterized protein LOC134713910 isoform X2 n=1 Tax=Mytilus trossulus TaxID=6551 RepID=UPI003004D058